MAESTLTLLSRITSVDEVVSVIRNLQQIVIREFSFDGENENGVNRYQQEVNDAHKIIERLRIGEIQSATEYFGLWIPEQQAFYTNYDGHLLFYPDFYIAQAHADKTNAQDNSWKCEPRSFREYTESKK